MTARSGARFSKRETGDKGEHDDSDNGRIEREKMGVGFRKKEVEQARSGWEIRIECNAKIDQIPNIMWHV